MSTVTYPPTAHVANQPAPSSAMVLESPHNQTSKQMQDSKQSQDIKKGGEEEQSIDGKEQTMRLRGGCIPCPDGGCCFIIPLPCCC